MTPQIVLSFLSFVALSGITPGPANLTSIATSLTYGKNSALRQWVGLISGYITDAMISVLIAYFLGTALNEYVKYLAFVGVAYLMWMAFHMLKTNYSTEQKEVKQPGFWRGYFLQLTNVKVILTCITALSSYVLPVTRSFSTLLIFGFCLGVIQPTCNLVWLFTGVALQRFFVKYQKIINVVMAVLLMLCAVSLAVVPFKKTTSEFPQAEYDQSCELIYKETADCVDSAKKEFGHLTSKHSVYPEFWYQYYNYPVGKVNLMDIYPMDFEEFLAATAFKRYIKENSPELAVRYSLLPHKEQENMVNIPLYYVGKIKIR